MKKKLSDTKNFYLIIIALYSFLINFYYADFGVFPIDTFLHYDAGFRVLKNEFPVKDFWIVSGFIVDFIQALFFKVFGVSWVSYKIHASTFNLILTIFSFYFFSNLGLSNLNSLIYSICFATLAYTISGTPFVDLHASFFLLLSTFILIIAITNSKKYLWFIVVSLFFLSFLSKQVPFAYAVILQGPIIIYFMVKKMNYNENIFIDNCMIIDLNGNNFIYNNQDIRYILMNAVQNNIPNNSNVFNVVTFRNIQIISNNLNELSSLVGNMVQTL